MNARRRLIPRFTSAMAMAVGLAITGLASSAQAQSMTPALTIGHVDTVMSTVLKEPRRILMYLPPSYHDTTVTPQRYPVLLLLDAEVHFHSVTGMIQSLAAGDNGGFALPEMIVVGVTNTNRMRDLTPTRATKWMDGSPMPGYVGTMGGWPSFAEFLEKELMPHVDAHYRTMPYRVFVGHSLGGLVAIDAMRRMPKTFQSFVAIDPSIWWDEERLLQETSSIFTKGAFTNTRLFLAKANTLQVRPARVNGHFSAITQFDALASRLASDAGVRYTARYYEQDDHGTVPLIATYDALRTIFAPLRIDMEDIYRDPTVLRTQYERASRELGVSFTLPETRFRTIGLMASMLDTTATGRLVEMGTQLYPTSETVWRQARQRALARGDSVAARTALERSAVAAALNMAPSMDRGVRADRLVSDSATLYTKFVTCRRGARPTCALTPDEPVHLVHVELTSSTAATARILRYHTIRTMCPTQQVVDPPRIGVVGDVSWNLTLVGGRWQRTGEPRRIVC